MDILFKIIELPMMKMASFHVKNHENPEEEAFEKLKKWSEPRGLFDNPSIHQVFGRNNPMPVNNPKLRGYEFLISLSDDDETNDIDIVDFPGGLYVVVQSRGIEQMQENWGKIMKWIKESKRFTFGYPEGYDHANMPSLEMEHHIEPLKGPYLIDYYFPIKDKEAVQ